MEQEPDVADTEELLLQLDRIEDEVVRARRAAETTRMVAIGFAIFFLGVPLIGLLINLLMSFS